MLQKERIHVASPLAWLLSLLLFVPDQLMAGTPCPAIMFGCNGLEQTSSNPQAQITCDTPAASGSLAYDLTAGTLSAYGESTVWQAANAYVIAVDRYRVSAGLPAGTPVTFNAELVVSASGCNPGGPPGCCGGGASGSIGDGISLFARVRADSPYEGGCEGVTDTARISLTRPAETEFDLRLTVDAGGSEYGSGGVGAYLRFTNLPPGAIVTSCHGFRQEIATPAVKRSWGELKVTYR